ncbi:hypothetical protein [Neptuniibacter sp.]|uniref:hypothetical protein n=1 Tax=Neptuniibacter sp. TaxID=1962643 RepID=UPI002610BFDA|nr:hypothetical protein [Neptuniibacter sp.]MCP4595865.1 hypothetical protein [Neptuniibacter sp.]
MSIRFLSQFLIIALISGCTAMHREQAPQAVFSGDVHLVSRWPSQVKETSGLAQYGGILWTINDSGDGAWLYGLDEQHQVKRKIKVAGAKNYDWEELAQDNDHLYIADCGNNRGHRNILQIYKIRLEELGQPSTRKVKAIKLQFSYADKPLATPDKNHNFDCEALAVVDDELWLFTKNRGDQQTKLYRLDKNQQNQVVKPSRSYPVNGLITAADYDERTDQLILLGYGKNVLFGQSFIWLVPLMETTNGKEPDWSTASFKKLHPYAQWEVLLWNRQSELGHLLLSTEKSPLLDVSLGEMRLPVNPVSQTSTK